MLAQQALQRPLDGAVGGVPGQVVRAERVGGGGLAGEVVRLGERGGAGVRGGGEVWRTWDGGKGWRGLGGKRKPENARRRDNRAYGSPQLAGHRGAAVTRPYHNARYPAPACSGCPEEPPVRPYGFDNSIPKIAPAAPGEASSAEGTRRAGRSCGAT